MNLSLVFLGPGCRCSARALVVVLMATTGSMHAQTPNLVDMVAMATSEIEGSALKVDGTAILSMWDQDGNEWKTSSCPTRFSCLYDGLSPGRFKVEFAPLISPWIDGLAPFRAKNVSIAFDGSAYCEYVDSSGTCDEMKPVRTGIIRALDPGEDIAELELFRITGASYTLPYIQSVTKQSMVKVLRGASEDLVRVTIAGEPAEKKGFVKIEALAGSPVRETIWLDPKRGYALKEFEYSIYNLQGRDTGTGAKFTVNDYLKVGNLNTLYPKSMVYEYSVKGKPSRRWEVEIDSAVIENTTNDKDFRASFPPGTSVRDERFGVSFRVGEDLNATVKGIKAQANE